MDNKKTESRKKKLSVGLLFLVSVSILGLVSILIINVCVKSSVKDKIMTVEEAASLDSDCILILGAGVWDGGRPSYMLEDRLLQGIELYENGASDRLLMSGDHSRKEYDEVNVMKRFAIDKGINSEHIFMDHAGFSTYESLYRARDVFQADRIIIVTQRYHLYRALYIAENLGLEAYGVASDPRQYFGQEIRDLRETLARVKDFFTVIFKPEPTYLGEAIPLSGNGDLTND
ncbi:SanA/YdcF family protein [Syntrophaceticus schinkii]|jgi:SanA protein|uniref:Putative SanA protein n=1 Tax=Syntrophaceticus schinkii TaxID=499207 RepID=A0A0B7MQW6_9FIRM|nr:ElyC/SanA/YdcF family protein [Syntrophaceticus schinkii]MDD4261060.1 ElyC/SanA/YdcF family protein [Syntrophaceticus schinkii]MDD4674584.1 ElyC/SanA/YdcF family protein [Syntrophaceticus schinkii]CEO90396.1 putative SanA protein [Syntrophaceticus schinkii]